MEALKYTFLGCDLPVSAEDAFDALFRGVGPGTFQAAYRAALEDEGDTSLSAWHPEVPREIELAAVEPAEPSFRRQVRVQRVVSVAAWARMLVSLPERLDCQEEWSLQGLGKGNGFLISVRSTYTGHSVAECFALLHRFRVTPKESPSQESKAVVSLSAEAEMQWLSSHTFASRIEKAMIDGFRRNFETQFMPLAGRWMAVMPQGAGGGYSPESGGASRRRVFLLEDGSFRSPPGAPPRTADIESEYDTDWSHGTVQQEVRVEVRSASDLVVPEYRVGDYLQGWLGGKAALLSNVYVEIELCGRKVSTNCACNPDCFASVGFEDERALFTYRPGDQIKLWVRDRRKVQSALRGDPLIGEGALELPEELVNMLPHWADVPLTRGGSPAGIVSIRLQLLTIPGLMPKPTSANPVPEAQLDFHTPPDSPRDESF